VLGPPLDVAIHGAPHLADLLMPGTSAPIALSGDVIAGLLSRRVESQTRRLLEMLRDRIAKLEAQGHLHQDRFQRLEDDLGGLQAIAANALAVEAKTELYADMLAGIVSTEVTEPVDVESFLATLQNLSVQEVGIARAMYETWRSDKEQQAYGVYSPTDLGGHAQYHMKRLEGAGPVEPVTYPGRETRQKRYTLTPTLVQLVELLEAGRAEPTDAETAGAD
jgi:hypothetical protein